MKKSTFLFSLLLSVAAVGLQAQKPKSGTYTITSVSNPGVTLATDQFLGIGALNEDGTYQTYSMNVNRPGSTTVFDVYAKLDELLTSLKKNVMANTSTTGYLHQLTAPDMATMLQLVTDGYTKINVEPTGTTDEEGNAIVRFKVDVPTIPVFVDNAFMSLTQEWQGITGASRKGLWDYALSVLEQEYATDPAGAFIVATAKTQLYPIKYKPWWKKPVSGSDLTYAPKSTSYYIYAKGDGTFAFVKEEYLSESTIPITLWTLKGDAQPENYNSGEYNIRNVGSGMYINYDGSSVTAQPNLNNVTVSTEESATTNLQIGRLRSGNGVYQIDGFTVNGKDPFDYIVNTLSPKDQTIKDYTNNEIRTKRGFYDESLTSGYNFFTNYGYIKDYETVMVADWYIRAFGKLKMQDNGDGTFYFYFDIPEMPYTSIYLEQFFGSANLWETLKNAALDEIEGAEEREYAYEQLGKLNPGRRYYIVANDANEFDFISAVRLEQAGDKAKWTIEPKEMPALENGYYRIQNATTDNIIEFHGTDASTVAPTSDEEDALSNPATIVSVKFNELEDTYEISSMRSQGVDVIAPLQVMLTKLANKAGLEKVPRFNLKPVTTESGEPAYVGYFDVPEMTHQQYLAVLALIYNDVKNLAATKLFLSNVEPGKRYSVAQNGSDLSLIAVEGDEPTDYNVWKLKAVDNVSEKYAVNVAEKVQATEEDITYYYSTLNTDYAYQIPEDGDIVGVYIVPEVKNGIAHPEKIGGPGLVIPANTPVIIESLSTGTANNQLYVIADPDAVETYDNNLLIGTLLAEPVEANGRSRANLRVFNISSKGVVGFYKYTGEMLVANKGYLDLSKITEPLVNTYAISFDAMGPTGIVNILSEKMNGSNEIYDIQGRKVNNPTKGLYIINGQKVLVK